jgi:hypothetical protein
VANVDIVSADRFDIGNETYDLNGVLDLFSAQLKQAEVAGCVQSIRVSASSGVSVNDDRYGKSMLSRHFYVDDAPRD